MKEILHAPLFLFTVGVLLFATAPLRMMFLSETSIDEIISFVIFFIMCYPLKQYSGFKKDWKLFITVTGIFCVFNIALHLLDLDKRYTSGISILSIAAISAIWLYMFLHYSSDEPNAKSPEQKDR